MRQTIRARLDRVAVNGCDVFQAAEISDLVVRIFLRADFGEGKEFRLRGRRSLSRDNLCASARGNGQRKGHANLEASAKQSDAACVQRKGSHRYNSKTPRDE